jgi:iron(II)-dependent oxidoreductase
VSATPVRPEVLAGWVRDGCQRTLELVADLDDEQLIGPQLPTVNPLL